MSNTFKNLALLKKEQESVKQQLGVKYEEVIAPFIAIIKAVMRGNQENEFSAMKRIKDKSEIYKKKDSPLLFSAALVDIVEEKHFQGFAN